MRASFAWLPPARDRPATSQLDGDDAVEVAHYSRALSRDGTEPTTEIDPTEAVDDITVQAVTVWLVVVIGKA